MITAKCRRCGHEWIPRKDIDKIQLCPSCKTRNWRGAAKKEGKHERRSTEHWA